MFVIKIPFVIANLNLQFFGPVNQSYVIDTQGFHVKKVLNLENYFGKSLEIQIDQVGLLFNIPCNFHFIFVHKLCDVIYVLPYLCVLPS